MSQKEYLKKPSSTVFSNLKNKTLAQITSDDFDHCDYQIQILEGD